MKKELRISFTLHLGESPVVQSVLKSVGLSYIPMLTSSPKHTHHEARAMFSEIEQEEFYQKYLSGEPEFDDTEKNDRYKQWREMYCPQHVKAPVTGSEKCRTDHSDKLFKASKQVTKLDDPVILYSTGSLPMEKLLKLPTPVKKPSSKMSLPEHSKRVLTSSESLAMFKEKQKQKEDKLRKKQEKADKKQQKRNGITNYKAV